MKIDLRSDTVTKPTVGMKAAMLDAKVGDDVYGEDPTVNELQAKAAKMFGKERALFCPSGTMCNQIAIRLSTQPQDEVICDQFAHIYLYEAGGIASNSLASVRILKGPRGKISPEMIKDAILPPDQHYARSSMVALENSINKGGGSFYHLSEIAEISQYCKQNGLRLHLDGARIFNALEASGDAAADYGAHFDTISFCLSKGLGAPIGSLLLLDEANFERARRIRKVMGGGMRQAGFLAAAGIYALDNHIERLKEDHLNAKALGVLLNQQSWVQEVMPVDTNIIGFKPDPSRISAENLILRLKSLDILSSPFGGGFVRWVTHLDITEGDVDQIGEKISKLEV